MLPATVPLPAARSRCAVPAWTGSLRVAVTVVVGGIPVALDAGLVPVTVGGVVSETLVSNTVSTQ